MPNENNQLLPDLPIWVAGLTSYKKKELLTIGRPHVFLGSESCLPNVVNVCGLYILDYLFGFI